MGKIKGFKMDKKEISRMFITILGSLLFAFGVNFFIVPMNFYNGGFVGIGQIIRTVLVTYLNINFGNIDIAGSIFFILNIPLLILAYRKLGKHFFVKTIICVICETLFMTLIPSPAIPIIDDQLAACFIGGMIAGFGSGLILRAGGSGGGTDIIGVYFTKKYKNFSVGKINILANIFVYGICAFLFNISTVIYSVIYMAISSTVIDRTHLQNICTEVIIFTKEKSKEIREYISEDLYRGSTYWSAQGGYTDEGTTIIFTVVSKHELTSLRRAVHEIDNKAFVVTKDNILVDGYFIKKV